MASPVSFMSQVGRDPATQSLGSMRSFCSLVFTDMSHYFDGYLKALKLLIFKKKFFFPSLNKNSKICCKE